MTDTRTVLVEHPGRLQPYTLWVRGKVHKFFYTLEKAELYIEKKGIKLDA